MNQAVCEDQQNELQLAEDLERIVQEIFLLMTRIVLEPMSVREVSNSWIGARLCYRSSPKLELEMLCEPSLAFAATQQLMALASLPVVVDEVVKDCVGEILNMVGGNFHSLLAPGEALDTTPRPSHSGPSCRSVRMETCLGAEQGCVRLRLIEPR